LVELALEVCVVDFFIAGLVKEFVEGREGENQTTLLDIELTLKSLYSAHNCQLFGQYAQKKCKETMHRVLSIYGNK